MDNLLEVKVGANFSNIQDKAPVVLKSMEDYENGIEGCPASGWIEQLSETGKVVVRMLNAKVKEFAEKAKTVIADVRDDVLCRINFITDFTPGLSYFEDNQPYKTYTLSVDDFSRGGEEEMDKVMKFTFKNDKGQVFINGGVDIPMDGKERLGDLPVDNIDIAEKALKYAKENNCSLVEATIAVSPSKI